MDPGSPRCGSSPRPGTSSSRAPTAPSPNSADPGLPPATIALPRRDTGDLLAEELRRLDADEVYGETLAAVAHIGEGRLNLKAPGSDAPAKVTKKPAIKAIAGDKKPAAKPIAAKKKAPTSKAST